MVGRAARRGGGAPAAVRTGSACFGPAVMAVDKREARADGAGTLPKQRYCQQGEREHRGKQPGSTAHVGPHKA